jgi:anti-sigma factor RsiW
MDCVGLREDLLDVLYGEAGPETRRRVEAHMASCPACREEMTALRTVRSELQGWKTPVLRPLTLRRPPLFGAPGLAAAAAIVLLSVAALGLLGTEVRYDRDGFRVSFGRGGEPKWAETYRAQALRQETEIQGLRAELAALRASGGGDSDLTQVVAQMIRDSEARQAQRIESAISGVAERVEARRRYDMARIGAGLAYLDGKNGQQFSRTAALMGHVLEASQKRGER